MVIAKLFCGVPTTAINFNHCRLAINTILASSCTMLATATIVSAASANEILDTHNKYRSAVGVPRLTWDDNLRRQAKDWANHLARIGKLEHSRSGQGENLWRGTSRKFSYTQMVDAWGSEKRYFKNGIFPDVSKTGNWKDVGHYSQMIWRNTTKAGCDGTDSGGYYYFVCRYYPPGNVRGQSAY